MARYRVIIKIYIGGLSFGAIFGLTLKSIEMLTGKKLRYCGNIFGNGRNMLCFIFRAKFTLYHCVIIDVGIDTDI